MLKPFETDDFDEDVHALEGEDRERGGWRRWIEVLSLLYSIALVLLCLAFRYVGEEWWLLNFALYCPSYLWLIPALLLLPVAIFFRRRALVPLGISLGIWLFLGAGYQLRLVDPVPTPGRKQLSVISCNVAEANGTNVSEFVRKHSPDLILLQEAGRREGNIDTEFPEYHLLKAGAYHLLSRFPIKGVSVIQKPLWRRPLGVIFEIEWEGEVIEIYSVHIPTLRNEVKPLLAKSKKEEPFQERLDFFRDSMKARVRLAHDFSEVLGKNRRPMIVAGDFNMPANGALYRLYTAQLTDAFAAAGSGFGYSCPAYDPQFSTPLGPWLRIDYLLCNQAFRPIACEVERDRPSQHRGVYAKFEWVGHPKPAAP